MDNSVIISSIMQRIEYYASSIGIASNVEKKYIKEQIGRFKNNITQPQVLFVDRLLRSFDVAMGEKRTTTKMYLERDLKNIEEIGLNLMQADKNKGRNFVNIMKQNQDASNIFSNIIEDGVNESKGYTLTKKNSSSSAYKLYQNSIN